MANYPSWLGGTETGATALGPTRSNPTLAGLGLYPGASNRDTGRSTFGRQMYLAPVGAQVVAKKSQIDVSDQLEPYQYVFVQDDPRSITEGGNNIARTKVLSGLNMHLFQLRKHYTHKATIINEWGFYGIATAVSPPVSTDRVRAGYVPMSLTVMGQHDAFNCIPQRVICEQDTMVLALVKCQYIAETQMVVRLPTDRDAEFVTRRWMEFKKREAMGNANNAAGGGGGGAGGGTAGNGPSGNSAGSGGSGNQTFGSGASGTSAGSGGGGGGRGKKNRSDEKYHSPPGSPTPTPTPGSMLDTKDSAGATPAASASTSTAGTSAGTAGAVTAQSVNKTPLFTPRSIDPTSIDPTRLQLGVIYSPLGTVAASKESKYALNPTAYYLSTSNPEDPDKPKVVSITREALADELTRNIFAFNGYPLLDGIVRIYGGSSVTSVKLGKSRPNKSHLSGANSIGIHEPVLDTDKGFVPDVNKAYVYEFKNSESAGAVRNLIEAHGVQLPVLNITPEWIEYKRTATSSRYKSTGADHTDETKTNDLPSTADNTLFEINKAGIKYESTKSRHTGMNRREIEKYNVTTTDPTSQMTTVTAGVDDTFWQWIVYTMPPKMRPDVRDYSCTHGDGVQWTGYAEVIGAVGALGGGLGMPGVFTEKHVEMITKFVHPMNGQAWMTEAIKLAPLKFPNHLR